MRKDFNYFFLQIIHGGYLDLRPVPVHSVLDFKGHLVPSSGSYLRKKEFRRNSSEYLSTENHLTCSHSPQVSVHQPFLIIRNQLWLQTDGTTQLHFITFSCFIWWQPSHFIITRRTKKKSVQFCSILMPFCFVSFYRSFTMTLQLCSALSYSILVKGKLFVSVYLWQYILF